MDKRKYRNQRGFQFFIALLCVVFLSFIIFPKKEISSMENRKLTGFPSLSFKTIQDGSFTKDFETYFSDHFPLREQMMKLNASFYSFFSPNIPMGGDLQIIKVNKGKAATKGLDSLVKQNTKSKEDYLKSAETKSTSANQTNQTNQNNQKDTSKKEDDKNTEEFMKKARAQRLQFQNEADAMNINNILIVGNRALDFFGYLQKDIDDYANLLNLIDDNKPRDLKIYTMVFPMPADFYIPDAYKSSHTNSSVVIQELKKQLNKDIVLVDSSLEIEKAIDNNEDLYFRTDHHWNQRGAYYAYKTFAKAIGSEASALSDMDTGIIDGPFYGSLYRLSDGNEKLKENPDTVQWWQPKVQIFKGIAVNDGSSDETKGYELPLINKTYTDPYEKYGTFTEGDHGYLHYQTNKENKKSICVIKDSWGNAFVPYLAEQYQDIYVLDPRYFNEPLLPFLKENKIDNLLVVGTPQTPSIPSWYFGFETMIKG